MREWKIYPSQASSHQTDSHIFTGDIDGMGMDHLYGYRTHHHCVWNNSLRTHARMFLIGRAECNLTGHTVSVLEMLSALMIPDTLSTMKNNGVDVQGMQTSIPQTQCEVSIVQDPTILLTELIRRHYGKHHVHHEPHHPRTQTMTCGILSSQRHMWDLVIMEVQKWNYHQDILDISSISLKRPSAKLTEHRSPTTTTRTSTHHLTTGTMALGTKLCILDTHIGQVAPEVLEVLDRVNMADMAEATAEMEDMEDLEDMVDRTDLEDLGDLEDLAGTAEDPMDPEAMAAVLAETLEEAEADHHHLLDHHPVG